ncbi:MAG: hypothetical protein ACJ72M_13290 [Propionibacteriaceae bacterium]|jgi:hypothetical protein
MMNKLYYDAPTQLTGRDSPPTDLGESPTDIALDRASQQIPTPTSTPPSESTQVRERARSAGVVVTRLLAVLVVVMFVTSILGFTLLERHGGSSATAIGSLAIGGSAAVLGLIFGFLEAHEAS